MWYTFSTVVEKKQSFSSLKWSNPKIDVYFYIYSAQTTSKHKYKLVSEMNDKQ